MRTISGSTAALAWTSTTRASRPPRRFRSRRRLPDEAPAAADGSNLVVVALAAIVAVTVLVVVGSPASARIRRRHPPRHDDRSLTTAGPGATTTGQDAADDSPRPRPHARPHGRPRGSYVQVRRGGVNGKLLWEGTLEQGQTHVREVPASLARPGEPQKPQRQAQRRRLPTSREPAVVLVKPPRRPPLSPVVASMRPRAVVVLTGSELARGDKADANGAFIARELTLLAWTGDDPDRRDDPGEL